MVSHISHIVANVANNVAEFQTLSAMNLLRLSSGSLSKGYKSMEIESTHAAWTISNELHLIQYLTEHFSEAGDGNNFKRAVWVGAAADQAKHHKTGSPMTQLGCKNKWAWVCCPYLSIK